MNTFKILLVTQIGYDSLISSFYRRNPDLKELSYSDHKNFLIDYCPVHLNSFSSHMRNLGHECEEIVYDLESLQKSWAYENNVKYGPVNWKEDIMMEQIFAFKPELIFFQGAPVFSGWLLTRIKELIPSVQKVVVHNGNPGNIKDNRGIDLILGCIPSITDYFIKLGANSKTLYYYFDEKVLQSLNNLQFFGNSIDKEIESSFVGFSGFGGLGNTHSSRFMFLESLLENTNIEMWLIEGSKRDPNLNIDTIPLLQQYPNRCHQGVMGLDMYNILQKSTICLNKHGALTFGNVGNMRIFEATGVGSCLVTDTAKNMDDLFEPDHEVITYKSTEECLEKLKYLSLNLSEAKKIGQNAQKKALQYHSLKQRCDLLNEYFQELFI